MADLDKSESQEVTSGTHIVAADGSIYLAKDSIILGRFQVLGLLGKGGMGSVFHIRHIQSDAEFALKVLAKQSDDTSWRRFDNEAKAASRLDHPNLIKVHESGLLPDGQAFFIMEMVKGETLSDLIKKNGRLPLQKVIKIFIQVGFALSYAHENGVIHRDLKPSNIMISKGDGGSMIGAVKVVDLGIAKLTGIDEFNQQTLTRTGEIFGSPLYMSPEQCLGIPVDTRTDLYSLGCSMYEALTGAPPIIGDNALSTMMKHQTDKPLSLKEASLGIFFPPEIERLLARLLEKEPEKRYQNAQLLTHDLVQIDQLFSERGYPADSSAYQSAPQEIAKQATTKVLCMQNMLVLVFAIGAFFLGYATSQMMNPPMQTKTTAKPNDTFGSAITSPRPAEVEAAPKSSVEPLSEISADGKRRIFNFPNDSIGKINIGKPYYQPARGRISLPKDAPVVFELEPRYMQSPDMLNRFAPDDITHLVLMDEMQSNPGVLSALPRFTRLYSVKILMPLEDKAFHYIDEIPSLTNLQISNTNFSGASIAKMKRWSKLTQLSCKSIPQIQSLIEKLPESNIEDLRIADNNLTVDNLKTIARMKNLADLSIGGNKCINDETIKLLKPLTKLKSLFVIACPLTGRCIETLKSFKHLKHLEISIYDPKEAAALKKELPRVVIKNVVRGSEIVY